jgi:glycosyltransferase involved in cell wall biosynthesis
MSNEFNSLVDVVVPIRNGEKWLSGLLLTISDQTYKPNKLILVDDHSDLPIEIKMIEQRQIPSVIIHSAIGRGLSNARNEGIDLCTSEYIAFLDVDDRWSPKKLEKHIEFLENNSKFVAVFSNASTIDLEGQVLRNHISSVSEVSTECLILEKTPVLGSASSIVIRRKQILETGYFDLDLNYAEDLDYWIRLSTTGKIGCLPEILTFITENPHSMQRGITPLEKYTKEISSKLYIFKKHPNFLPEVVENLGRTLLFVMIDKSITFGEKVKLLRMTIRSKTLSSFYSFTLFLTFLIKNFLNLTVKVLSRKAYLSVAIPFHFVKKVFATMIFVVKMKKRRE